MFIGFPGNQQWEIKIDKGDDPDLKTVSDITCVK